MKHNWHPLLFHDAALENEVVLDKSVIGVFLALNRQSPLALVFVEVHQMLGSVYGTAIILWTIWYRKWEVQIVYQLVDSNSKPSNRVSCLSSRPGCTLSGTWNQQSSWSTKSWIIACFTQTLYRLWNDWEPPDAGKKGKISGGVFSCKFSHSTSAKNGCRFNSAMPPRLWSPSRADGSVCFNRKWFQKTGSFVGACSPKDLEPGTWERRGTRPETHIRPWWFFGKSDTRCWSFLSNHETSTFKKQRNGITVHEKGGDRPTSDTLYNPQPKNHS